MKLRNITLVIIFILLGLGFSSCDSHSSSWVAATLDRKASFYTDSRGEIYSSFRIDERDIYTNGGYSSIRDIEFVGDEEIRLDVWSNARIHEMWLHIDGTDVELYFENVLGANDYYGGQVFRFMEVLVDQIHRHGYVIINVEGYNVHGTRNIQLDVQVLADVDVYVRD